ncbi:MAG: hypothetical protein IKY92_03585 [Akkermansia sp.]|nr:hypothetical protein [Akkermansia sp.]
MATSGSFNTTAYNADDGTRYLTFAWEETSQNIAANTTTISWTLKAGGTSTQSINGRNIKLIIDGVTVYTFGGGAGSYKNLDQGTKVASGTYTFTHKADGTRTFAASAEAGIYVWAVNCTGSKTFTLDTIPRATTPTVSASSVDMGSAVTISMPRASSAFTHDLAYSFAGAGYVSIATGVGTSYSWTTPDLASKIPNATSGTLTIRCITKNGSTTIGTKTVTMTLKVPTSVVPTISAVATTEATSGLAAQFGAFVKGKSKIKATITAAGAKGSTIKSYSTTFNGKTYTGSSWTSGLVTASGSLSLVTTVTDSRGRTAKKTTTITVLDYSAPKIYTLQVHRVNERGDADQDGVFMMVNKSYSVDPINGKNTANMLLEYKVSTAATWETLETGTALEGSPPFVPDMEFSVDFQYDVRLTVTDWFGASTSYNARLQSGAVILDIGADGKSLGLFTVATREGVDFGASAKGAVLGLWEATANIPENGDFNDYTQPGVYGVAGNAVMETLKNRPIDKAGTLRVSSGLGVKKVSGAWAYIIQEFHCYDNSHAIYRRHLHSNGEGVFSAGAWRAITFRGQKVLWEGGRYMTAGHTAELSEPVSLQDNGIVLVFSTYSNGAPVDSNFQHFFVPKKFVEIMNGYGCTFQMNTVNFNYVAAKYLYIHDDYITGNESNNLSGTATSGIVFNNAMYVLRYVLGV